MFTRSTRQCLGRCASYTSAMNSIASRQTGQRLAQKIIKPRLRCHSTKTTKRPQSTVQDTLDDSDNRDYRATKYPYPYPRIRAIEVDHPEIASCIRSCLTTTRQDDPNKYAYDTAMSICFLGTSAGMPTKERNPSATILRMGSEGLLFDAGEGIQRQLLFSRIKPFSIKQIFITHLHGDHIFGLPGFLLQLNQDLKNKDLIGEENAANQGQTPVVKIYGPPGLHNYIASVLTLSCAVVKRIVIEVYELVGSPNERIVYRNPRNPFEHSYPEFNQMNIHRRFIEPDDNGIWTIKDFDIPAREDILGKSYAAGDRTKDWLSCSIKAAEVRHVPGVVTFGYAVEESEPPRNIDAKRAMALGIRPGKKFALLKHGFSVESDDGRVIQPEQVLVSKTKKARKVVVIGDNCEWSKSMISLARDADVLVHEATLLEEAEEVCFQRVSALCLLFGY